MSNETENILSSQWKNKGYDSCLKLLMDNYVPSLTCVPCDLDTDAAACLGYGGLSWNRFSELYWTRRDKEDNQLQELLSGLKRFWLYGHEVARHEARKQLEEALSAKDDDKVSAAVITGLKLLRQMTEEAGIEQDNSKADDSDMSDEEALAIFQDLKGAISDR